MVEMKYVPTAVAIIGLIVIWTLETWWPFVAGRRGRLRHARRNLTLGALNVLAIGLLIGPFLYVVTRWVEETNFGLLRLVSLPPVVSTALAFLLLDGWMYFWHRVSHQVPLLWRLHRTHHSDAELDVTTSVRFHSGEVIISGLLRLLLIPLLGLLIWQVLLYDAVQLLVIQLHHSNINISERWDRVLRLAIASPAMHRVHHSRRRTERDRNYSSIFSFWDRICGTFRLSRKTSAPSFGLDCYDVEDWQRVGGLLRTPFTGPDLSEQETRSAISIDG